MTYLKKVLKKIEEKVYGIFTKDGEVNWRRVKVTMLLTLGSFYVIVLLFAAFFPSTDPLALMKDRFPPPEIGSRAAVVMDAATGTFVFLRNPDKEIPPASLTKVMTMHLAFSEIAAGRAALEDIIIPPQESWAVNQPPRSSLMFLAYGQQVSFQELLLGLAVPSGNDAAVAVALHLAPSVEEFAEMMTEKAKAMGLTSTRFVEPSGISEYNMTTAREFAYFVRNYIQMWPESLSDFHSVRYFSFPRLEHMTNPSQSRVRTIRQGNSNSLLHTTEGVDGLRTGFIYASGFNTSLTAERNGTRFVAVILGAPATSSGRSIREADGRNLLEWAFSSYSTVRLELDELQRVRVLMGSDDYAVVEFGAPLEFTAPLPRGKDINWKFSVQSPLIAPLYAGSKVGNLIVSDTFGELKRIPLLVTEDVQRGTLLKQIFDMVSFLSMR
ncbi:MAG: D-alanyl-D-alanine carboxypeptidase [Treponema sp.]|jgi:D-alanyl-D-alanine carboxypeptidase (penicillin-binding protein 5/6)|nr:D-alanyl-D-alanine carboxypeptidase [Treponema sp.]